MWIWDHHCTVHSGYRGSLYDEGKSEYNFGLHQKNYRGGLGHTLGDQNQPLFKSPYGSP